MFKIGDEVICIKDNSWCEKGDWGIVTGFSSIGNPEINFKERKAGKSYKFYVEPEYLQLKNQSNIKPEDMVSGEWYFVYTDNRYLLQFLTIKSNIVSCEKGFNFNLNCKITNTDKVCRIRDIKYIAKGTKEQVFKYFPDEFKKPVNLDNRFKPNTWYKTTDSPYIFYVKNPIENKDLDIFKEHIWGNKYYETQVILGLKGTYNYVEVPLSEIQEYLPEGHVDKLKQDSITEYDGLKIGDEIPITVINEWIKIGNNYHSDGWKTKTNPYSTDIGSKTFTIREFAVNSGVVTVIPNEWSITEGFKAEGLKKFMNNYHKPKINNATFKVGDWVTILNTNIGPAEKIPHFKETGLTGKIQEVVFKSSYNYCVNDIWCNVRKATVQEIIAAGGKPDINDVLKYCEQKYPVGTKYKCIWRQVDNGEDKQFTIRHSLNIKFPEKNSIYESYSGYLYYNGKFAEIVESVKELCEMCGDTGKVLKAKLYPSGHTEEWEDCDECDYHEPVDMKDLVTVKTKGNNTYGEFNYEEAIKSVSTNKTLNLPIIKKQSKNNKPVLLKEQKLVNLSIKKQTKKSILLCQH